MLEKLLVKVRDVDQQLGSVALGNQRRARDLLYNRHTAAVRRSAELSKVYPSRAAEIDAYLAAITDFSRTAGYPELTLTTRGVKLAGIHMENVPQASVRAVVKTTGYPGLVHPAEGGPVAKRELIVAVCSDDEEMRPKLIEPIPEDLKQYDLPPGAVSVIDHTVVGYARSMPIALSEITDDTVGLAKNVWAALNDERLNPDLFTAQYLESITPPV